MKIKFKSTLLALIVLSLIVVGVLYLFNYKLVKTSSDKIAFSPGVSSKTITLQDSLEKPKNIILFIADGMGFSHLSLASLSQQAEGTPSVWQDFDIKGWHDPRSANGPLTDSEASATAIATGTSTGFGHIGIDRDGNSLKNIFEIASDQQYTSGIVTDSYVWDGTPAAFSAHIRNEDDARSILNQIADSELDLLFGELEDVGEDEVPEADESLEILSRRFQLLERTLDLPVGDNASKPIAAIFKEDEIQDLNSSPNLTQLTDAALDYLTSQDQPFILLVECEEMDSASHRNDSERVLKGLKSIQSTLSLIQSFARTDGETLVVFTSDHETGGLAVTSDFNDYPNMEMVWATKNHTAAVVPLFAKGPGAKYFLAVDQNWEIGELLKKLISQSMNPNE